MSVKQVVMAAAGALGGAGYTIDRSLRFNSADSAYLNRTPASNGSLTTVTFSYWVKRASLSNGVTNRHHTLYSAAYDWSSTDSITFNPSDNLILFLNGSSSGYFVTTQVFRDASSWYHIVIAIDTTQATEANRVKIYVNGEQITSFTTATYPTQNYNFAKLNRAAYAQGIGYAGNSGATEQSYFSGYMANVDFVDGQQLTPADFGEYNATTGVWQPIAYAGTYGTNGFHLNFSDNSSTSALGTDSSGNGNNWTANNFSVTAGASNDSLVDTPTPYGTDTGAGGEVGGNYCTLNPLTNGSYVTLSNGNLTAAGNTATDNGNYRGTINFKTGKWYMEATCTVYGSINNPRYGIIPTTNATTRTNAGTDSVGKVSNSVAYWADGTKEIAGSNTAYGSSFTNGDIIGIAIDADNGAIYFSKNGTWQNSGVPTSGASKTGAAFTWTGGSIDYVVAGSEYNAGKSDWNFGQRPFAYTAPSGFKALCTTNLPEPDVVQGDTAFNTVIYTGTGSSLGVTGVGFQPDFVWIKKRSAVADNKVFDVIRGATKELETNVTDAENTNAQTLTAFDADGFTLGTGLGVNGSGDTFVAWNWKAGGSGVSNTDGSITSTVSANPTAGFSVVTYTGTGTDGTVGHGLGAVPKIWISKSRNTATDWYVNTTVIDGSVDYLLLNSANSSSNTGGNFATAPTSSVIHLGAASGFNGSGDLMISYVFAPVEGFSAFGKYTGNGSTDGPFIYTGFRPAFVILKQTDTSGGNWFIHDVKRDTYNTASYILFANDSGSEQFGGVFDIVSNGFKLRQGGSQVNGSGGTYIYMAFAENPFKYSLAR